MSYGTLVLALICGVSFSVLVSADVSSDVETLGQNDIIIRNAIENYLKENGFKKRDDPDIISPQMNAPIEGDIFTPIRPVDLPKDFCVQAPQYCIPEKENK